MFRPSEDFLSLILDVLRLYAPWTEPVNPIWAGTLLTSLISLLG